jgi:transposase InsO family protein
MIGWYHRFVERFADIAKPLYELTKTNRKFKWTSEADLAFIKMKEAIIQDLVLAHPIFGKPFILRTNASDFGVGAVLSQTDEFGEERVVSFASKVLDKAQTNYTTSEKECYAIIFLYLESMRNTNQKLMRWSWKLQEWSPNIQYIKGKDNFVADFLSRNPGHDAAVVDREPEYMFPPIRTNHVSLPRSNLLLTCNIDRDTIRKHQVDAGDTFSDIYISDEFVKLNGIIYKVYETKVVPVIPESLIPDVIHQFHDRAPGGHQGVERTFGKLSRSCFFNGMRKRVQEHVKTCPSCQKTKPDNRKPPGLMQSSPITGPWDTLYMDLMGPYVKSHPGGYTYLLVVIDDFTKWTEVFPLRDATAARICKVLEESLFCRFGMPKTLVSDNGSNFTSQILAYLCKQWKIQQRFTSPYHPQSNLTERANRSIKTMIRAYLEGEPHKYWAKYIPFFLLQSTHLSKNQLGLLLPICCSIVPLISLLTLRILLKILKFVLY